ncbi:hypothetical protein WG66_010487 [Moniliophthora roreri]|nr:hypothetical protein WG66_010487 [Moniliophthora roreri]
MSRIIDLRGCLDGFWRQAGCGTDKVQLSAKAKQIVQIKNSLDLGNVIGVRVCARCAGWEDYVELVRSLTDGGGVRGVSPLRILKRIMDKVAEIEDKAGAKPYEYLDVMTGTSIGASWISYLGDSRYSTVFGKEGLIINTEDRTFTASSYLYEAKLSRDAVMDLVRKTLGNAEAIRLDKDPSYKLCNGGFGQYG